MSTQRTLEHSDGTRALEHLGHSGTRTLRQLHTWALEDFIQQTLPYATSMTIGNINIYSVLQQIASLFLQGGFSLVNNLVILI